MDIDVTNAAVINVIILLMYRIGKHSLLIWVIRVGLPILSVWLIQRIFPRMMATWPKR